MPKVSKPLFLAPERIMLEVDREKVAGAVVAYEENEPKMAEWDFEDAKRLIWLAAEKWLPRDLHEFILEATELKIIKEIPGLDRPFKGYLDLAGTVRGTIDPFVPFAGKKFVVDWKTSKNTLGTDWRNRLIDSWQWMDYTEIYGADVFCYRGLSRNGTTAEVILKVPQTNGKEVIQLLTSVGSQIKALDDGDFPVWPRNKPFACNAYGRECDFYQDCQEYTMPQSPIPKDKMLSYSFLNNFMLCNERARRTAIGERDAGTDETNFGVATHRGLAELWRQAYQIFGTK